MTEPQRASAFLKAGEPIDIPLGKVHAVIGGLVSGASRSELYVITVGRAASRATEGQATIVRGGQPLTGIVRTAQPDVIGTYVSISTALSLIEVPSDQFLEIEVNSCWAGAEIASPESTFLADVFVGHRDGPQGLAKVVALNAVMQIRNGEASPIAYHGALRLAWSGDKALLNPAVGSPVFMRDGALVGFVIASSDSIFVAPAQPLFDDLSIAVATRDQISKHNAAAGQITLRRETSRATTSLQFSTISRFVDTIPAWRYREIPEPCQLAEAV